MEYHEIGERFEFNGVELEVIEGQGDTTDCVSCYLRYSDCIAFKETWCNSRLRPDKSPIYYKLAEQCKTKDMEQKTEIKVGEEGKTFSTSEVNEDLEINTDSKKNDRLDDKLRWELLPLEDVEDIVRVYTAGAKKYGENKWQDLPDGIRRYKAALLRHLVEFDKGNEIDEETGCFHLAQCAWNAIAMLHISKQQMKNGNQN